MFDEIPKDCRYGYARVSSKSQQDNSSLETQEQQFRKHGVPEKNIRVEIGSAVNSIKERPIFQKLIEEELQPDDLLLVTKIDRGSRNTLEFLTLQEKMFKKSIKFISLDLPYSTDMAFNKLISTNLAVIATFENERRKECQRQGIEAAKKAGKYRRGKTIITKKLVAQVQDLKEKKKLSVIQITKITGKSRSTIYKVLKEYLIYKPANRLLKGESILDF